MKKNKKPLSLLFCGDFAPCRRWYKKEPNTNVFGNSLKFIKNSDLAFVNLECPTIKEGKPIVKDGPNLSTNPKWLESLKEANFNLLGLANNHFGDYGEKTVVENIDNCKKIGLNTVGAGSNLKEAQKVFYFEKNNIKIAIIAVCEHEFGIAKENKAGTAPLELIDNLQQIQDARKNADFVIFTIHGGNEYFPYPRPNLRKKCKFYIKQGCDAIICHHPHVPGAYEIYEGKPIFYSLGNFLFDNDNPLSGWNEGYMVRLELSNQIYFELIPYTQSFEQSGIKLMVDSEKDSFLKRIEDYKNTLYDKEKYEKIWNEFCKTKKDNYLILQYSPLYFKGIGRILKKFGVAKVLLTNIKRLASRLNHIRCESHRETFINILENELLKKGK